MNGKLEISPDFCKQKSRILDLLKINQENWKLRITVILTFLVLLLVPFVSFTQGPITQDIDFLATHFDSDGISTVNSTSAIISGNIDDPGSPVTGLKIYETNTVELKVWDQADEVNQVIDPSKANFYSLTFDNNGNFGPIEIKNLIPEHTYSYALIIVQIPVFGNLSEGSFTTQKGIEEEEEEDEEEPTPISTPVTSISCGLKGGIVPCEGPNCGFEDLMCLIKNVIDFLIFKLAMPLAAVAFAVAGFLFITGGADPGKRERGKKIFWNVLWGLVIALAAWLIVTAIFDALGVDEAYRLLK